MFDELNIGDLFTENYSWEIYQVLDKKNNILTAKVVGHQEKSNLALCHDIGHEVDFFDKIVFGSLLYIDNKRNKVL